MQYFTVVLFDEDLNELAKTVDVAGLDNAKRTAKDYLIDSEYEDDAYLVEIWNDDNETVWDKFA
jgi:hypothetical protein